MGEVYGAGWKSRNERDVADARHECRLARAPCPAKYSSTYLGRNFHGCIVSTILTRTQTPHAMGPNPGAFPFAGDHAVFVDGFEDMPRKFLEVPRSSWGDTVRHDRDNAPVQSIFRPNSGNRRARPGLCLRSRRGPRVRAPATGAMRLEFVSRHTLQSSDIRRWGHRELPRAMPNISTMNSQGTRK